MVKNLSIVILWILLFFVAGCNIKTPEIRGVVFDAETKQPVEGAWVRASIEIYTKTVGGDVHSSLSIDEPHTRTDKQGRFVIPSMSFKKPAFPVGFGTEVVNVGIGASTSDDKGGRMNLKEEKLKEFLGRNTVELTIYSTPIKRNEEEYFTHLQSLYNYCITGRSGVEVPLVEKGCDEWELNYAITKHEKYLERYSNPTKDQITHYSIALANLAYLYKRKGDYEKAISLFTDVKEFDKKHGITLTQKEYERQITELQLLKQKRQNRER
jgi:tetratricopeptide (TPR) repeat protein